MKTGFSTREWEREIHIHIYMTLCRILPPGSAPNRYQYRFAVISEAPSMSGCLLYENPASPALSLSQFSLYLYWVPQKLLQIYTVKAYIYTGKVPSSSIHGILYI